ncbi:class 1 fructose-bisphosphatase [Elioraea thermophila]|uniref:class 1 fructose-bisphosphatase n=1 Tax=Elioraea thermophila TaxID=2185104 RepID=UPI0018E532FA|nr:class 1 fructose-bisphosphatase [Elioraea thermophila]
MTTLREHLEAFAGSDPRRVAVAETVAALAAASVELADLLALGALAGRMAEVVGASNDGDGQKVLDVRSNEIFLRHLEPCPVAAIVSEEMDEVKLTGRDGPLAVAMDPLDGSNNIEQNMLVGSIFSLLPLTDPADPAKAFFQPGTAQLAAGFVVYGPSTVLALSLGDGTDLFTLHRPSGEWRLTHAKVRIPTWKPEYAINASNMRHWTLPIRTYIEELIAGASGPRGVDYNMRWLACSVGEALRILLRGGIYLYPSDARRGYERGRLRLLYEGFPIAFVIEQAGGMASDGFNRILELVPQSIHQKIPLIYGSREKVERVMAMHNTGVIPPGGQRPLFGERGLFKS